MSHFTVTITGQNIDEQLAPFIEQVNDKPEYAKYRKFKNCSADVRHKWKTETSQKWYSALSVNCDNPTRLAVLDGLLQNGEYVVHSLSADHIFEHRSYQLKEIAKGNVKNHDDTVHFYKWYEKNGTERKNWIEKDVYAVITDLVIDEVRNVNGFIETVFSAKFKRIAKPREVHVKKKYKDMFAYAKDYHGYIRKNGEYGYYHNPNAKWDWYQIGGRWCGFFLPKSELKYPNDIAVGNGGVMGNAPDKGWVDSIRKCDIDIEGMKEWTVKAAKEDWIKYQADLVDKPTYCNVIWNIPENVTTEEQYIEYRLKSYISTFALLKDGEWYEKGGMGWWGMVSNEKSEWQEEFIKMFESIPDDTLLTVVDCHI